MNRKLWFALAALVGFSIAGCSDGGTPGVSGNPSVPFITKQPQGAIYSINTQAAALTVAASISDGGTLSYRWYSNTEDSNEGGIQIPDAIDKRYTPPTDTAGTVYYYAAVINTLNGKTAQSLSNTAKIEVNDKANAVVPVISVQPQGTAYSAGAQADALTVAASVSDGGTLSYRWYSNTENSNEEGTPIEDADSASYTPLTVSSGAMYYYAVITNTIADNGDGGNKTAEIASGTAYIIVNDQVNAAVPVISVQPQGAAYSTGAQAAALTVAASVSDGGTLSYRWYSNTENSNERGTPIENADGASYTPPTALLGAMYYYAVITNTIADNEDGGNKTAETASDTAKVEVNNKVNAAVPVISVQPQGAAYSAGAQAAALTVAASVSDGGTLSYRWYSNTENSNEEGTPIEDADSASYTPLTVSLGAMYYYAVITNTIADNGDGGNKTAQTVSNTAEIGIDLIPVTITGLSAADKVYDGTATATASGMAALDGKLGGDDVSVAAGTAAFANKTVGTGKTVTFGGYALAGADAGKYMLLEQPASVTADITAKPVTITGLSAGNKTYDGTTAATASGTAAVNGKVGADAVTVSAGTAAFANKTVATGKTVTFSGYSLGGADAGNYTLSAQPASVTANITAKPVTITGLSASNKVYDGTTTVTITGTAAISGVVSGDTVTLGGTRAAVFASKTVGTGKTITISGYTLAGADAGNYSLTQPTLTANITAKPVTITGLSVSNKVYDGTTTATASGTAAVNGKVGADAVTVSAGTAAFANKTVATGKTVTFSGYSLGGADAGNYTLSAQPAGVTANITAKSVTITGLSASNKVYDGTTTATVTGTAAVNGKISTDTVTVSAGSAAFASAAVGSGKTVTFSGWSLGGADAGNYTLSAQPAGVTANITYVEMVSISAGTFTMGSPTTEANRGGDETQHSVTLSAFSIGKYQVTQEQYRTVMGTGTGSPSSFTTAVAGESGTPGKLPVEQVSWYDALVFCNKLSVMEGLSPAYRISGSTDPAAWGTVPTGSNATWNAVEIVSGSNGYRLPTEAQWEYACRAGTTTAYHTGETISDNTGWYNSNSGSKTHQVGLKTANAWGLYDMHGNVWEWCWDWYGSSYYSSSPTNDPVGASSGTNRVLRGGSWSNSAQNARSAYRYITNPYIRSNGLGFRVVRP